MRPTNSNPQPKSSNLRSNPSGLSHYSGLSNYSGLKVSVLAGLLLVSIGCASSNSPLPTVDQVDLDRFMGAWYVVGLIPNQIEKNAYESVESYAWRPDGKIAITYEYRKGSFQGPKKRLNMVARVVEGQGGAEWRVRPFWPVSLKYLVTDLADDYRYTVVAHPSRNYAWIMAREKTMKDRDWDQVLARLSEQGFELDRIVRVPQIPPEG